MAVQAVGLSFFLDYGTLALAAAGFVVLAVLLAALRKRLPPPVKTLLAVVLVLLAAYLAFVLWLVVGFGSNSAPPVPAAPPSPS